MALQSENEAYLGWMLSQLMDGELNKEQSQAVIQALSLYPRLQEKWRHWHLIREALQGEEVIIHAKKPVDPTKQTAHLISEQPLRKQQK